MFQPYVLQVWSLKQQIIHKFPPFSKSPLKTAFLVPIRVTLDQNVTVYQSLFVFPFLISILFHSDHPPFPLVFQCLGLDLGISFS